MKGPAAACIAACLATALSAQSGVSSAPFNDPGLFHDKKAEDLFTDARIAITGGPGGLARLQGMRLKGTSKLANGDGSMFEAAVEIRVQLPDKYLRVDSGSFGRRLTGYAGSTLLTLTEDAAKTIVAEPRDPATLTLARFELARLMLGAATWVSNEVQVKLYTRDAPADMPGPADALGVDAVGKNDSGFSARVVMDPKSRMPARVVYRGGDGIRTMTIAERKSAGGYRLPSRIVTTLGGRVVEELTFTDIAVNPRFGKDDFTK